MIHQLRNINNQIDASIEKRRSDSQNYTSAEKENMLDLTQQIKPDRNLKAKIWQKKLNIRIRITALQTKARLINKQRETSCNPLTKTKTVMMII